MQDVFLLLIIYQLKHFICDYPLQGRYMLGKFKPGWDFLGPLATHCSVHAGATFIIATAWGFSTMPWGVAWCLAFLDFVIHFFMDRIKAGPKYLGRFKDMMKPYFWWALGFDQMIHHLTHYWIIWILLRF